MQGGRRGGRDGPPDAADQRGGGGGGEGDGAGGGMHGSGARGAAGNAAVRRGALVRETRLAAGAAAGGGRGRERRSEAARWLDVRTAVGYEFEAGEVRELEMICELRHDGNLKLVRTVNCGRLGGNRVPCDCFTA